MVLQVLETGLVADAALTPGNVSDAAMAAELLAGEDPGKEIYADSAYGPVETRVALRRAGHDLAIKPYPLCPSVPAGFDREDFVSTSTPGPLLPRQATPLAISPGGGAGFERLCRGCELRARCTRAKGGRHPTIHRHSGKLVFARRSWSDPIVVEHDRAHRLMVERSLAWLVTRWPCYRGVARNQLWLTTRLGALNLRRLVNLGVIRDDGAWRLAPA